MAKYGFCEDCGSTMETVGCPNCDELDVIQQRDQFYEDEPELCPMGCGRTTEDPYGGPCSKCWDKTPNGR